MPTKITRDDFVIVVGMGCWVDRQSWVNDVGLVDVIVSIHMRGEPT